MRSHEVVIAIGIGCFVFGWLAAYAWLIEIARYALR